MSHQILAKYNLNRTKESMSWISMLISVYIQENKTNAKNYASATKFLELICDQ